MTTIVSEQISIFYVTFNNEWHSRNDHQFEGLSGRNGNFELGEVWARIPLKSPTASTNTLNTCWLCSCSTSLAVDDFHLLLLLQQQPLISQIVWELRILKVSPGTESSATDQGRSNLTPIKCERRQVCLCVKLFFCFVFFFVRLIVTEISHPIFWVDKIYFLIFFCPSSRLVCLT